MFFVYVLTPGAESLQQSFAQGNDHTGVES